MVAPFRHVGEFGGLSDDEALEIHRLATEALEALRRTAEPHGFNLGWNIGRAAGAGVIDHVHLHAVPRWGGDTNFMPVLADVKVLPEALETRRKLAEAWPHRSAVPAERLASAAHEGMTRTWPSTSLPRSYCSCW